MSRNNVHIRCAVRFQKLLIIFRLHRINNVNLQSAFRTVILILFHRFCDNKSKLCNSAFVIAGNKFRIKICSTHIVINCPELVRIKRHITGHYKSLRKRVRKFNNRSDVQSRNFSQVNNDIVLDGSVVLIFTFFLNNTIIQPGNFLLWVTGLRFANDRVSAILNPVLEGDIVTFSLRVHRIRQSNCFSAVCRDKVTIEGKIKSTRPRKVYLVIAQYTVSSICQFMV